MERGESMGGIDCMEQEFISKKKNKTNKKKQKIMFLPLKYNCFWGLYSENPLV